MVINVEWKCPCGEYNLAGFTEMNENFPIQDDIYYGYCSECGKEFAADNRNSKISWDKG